MKTAPQKRELTLEELEQLKIFIAHRGFGEPAVMLEILDHFACKVEELAEQNPSWNLDKLMIQAHLSFGFGGFYPLVKSYEEMLRKQYRLYFRQAFVNVFKSARGVGLVLLAPVLLYAVAQIGGPFIQSLTGEKSTEWLSWLAFFAFGAIDIYHIRLFPSRSNLFMRMANSAGNSGLLSLYLLCIVPVNSVPLPFILGMAAFISVLQQARYATLRKAGEEYQERVSCA